MLRSLLASVLLLSGCAVAHAAEGNPQPPVTSVRLGEITPDVTEPVAAELDARLQGGHNVLLQITSPGGSVFTGLEFIQHVENAKKSTGGHIICIVDEMAASMAGVILESGVCDVRLMTSRSFLLFHNASGQFAGNAHDVSRQLGILKAIDKAMAHLISERMGMPYKAYRAKVEGKDWTMDCVEAQQMGAIDGIISADDLPLSITPT